MRPSRNLMKSLHVHLEFLGPAIFKNDLFIAHRRRARREISTSLSVAERLKMLLRLLSLARTFSSSSLVGMLEIGKAICDSLKNIFLFSFLRFAKKEVTQHNNKSQRQISSVESFSCPPRIDSMNTRRQLIEFPPQEKKCRSFSDSYPG